MREAVVSLSASTVGAGGIVGVATSVHVVRTLTSPYWVLVLAFTCAQFDLLKIIMKMIIINAELSYYNNLKIHVKQNAIYVKCWVLRYVHYHTCVNIIALQ